MSYYTKGYDADTGRGIPHHRIHHSSGATVVAEYAEVDALIKETYVPEKAVLGTQRITYVPEKIILGTQQSYRHGTPPYIFHSFLGKGIRNVYEITKIRTIKGSEAKEFTPDETHSDDIRLTFHLRFHHKVSEKL